MKVKEYQLRFIKTYPHHLTNGMYVSLDGSLPIGEYRNKSDKSGTPNLGRIHEVIEDKRLGTIYRVKEDETGEIHNYIEEKLCPIAPVLVSDDEVGIGQIFYIDGVMDICDSIVEGNNSGIARCLMGRQTERLYISSMCNKIVARSHEIGYVINDGPPHDRNQRVSIYDKLVYLEDMHPDEISRLVYYGSKVRVLIDKDDKPIFFEGKIVIDVYGLYPSK